METINKNPPLIMHVDLNSCFATIKQQASPHLRGKPLVIAAYDSPAGCVLAPSIEAKKLGIKTGMTVREAKLLCKGVIVRTPDVALIRDAHRKFSKITKDYSPEVYPKSIDEVVIDFRSMDRLNLDLIDVGKEIKQRFRGEIGEWVSCNVGIAPNRFLAKLAASLHKPDGLDIITHQNLIKVYDSVSLTDLHGINTRYQARLNAQGIFTPLQFLETDSETLKRKVFQSIVGHHWYMRLRGYEIDDVEFKRKSFGQDFALGKKTDDPEELSRILMKLCEKMGRRLRKSGYVANGIHVGIIYEDGTYWHRGRKVHSSMYTTKELFTKVMWVFNQQPQRKVVGKLMVSCYSLSSSAMSQPTLFDEENKGHRVSDAIDQINDRYGEYVVTPALMMGMNDLVIERISFGATKGIEDLYI